MCYFIAHTRTISSKGIENIDNFIKCNFFWEFILYGLFEKKRRNSIFSTFHSFFVHYFQFSRIVWGKLSLLFCIFLSLIWLHRFNYIDGATFNLHFSCRLQILREILSSIRKKKTIASSGNRTQASWVTVQCTIHYTMRPVMFNWVRETNFKLHLWHNFKKIESRGHYSTSSLNLP